MKKENNYLAHKEYTSLAGYPTKRRNRRPAGSDTKQWERNKSEKAGIGRKQTTFLKEFMGELQNVIKNSTRLNTPLILKPHESTFIDVAIWNYHNKRLSISTIKSRLRYAYFMQNHKVPVDFNNPTYKNFRHHMDYREEIEGAGPYALINEWKTMKMFLHAFNMHWEYKPPTPPKHKRRNIPFPETVRKFFYHKVSKDPYENALYQYLFYHSFMVGWRVPSEPCQIKLSDITIDEKGQGNITITEPKKRKSKRTIVPEKFILSSKSHKSIKNWLDHWRPKVANQDSGDSLYLWPSGKPVTPETLRNKLSRIGKQIWPPFQPYTMRHWSAIARLIETAIDTGTFDTYHVQHWLGHDKPRTTGNYIGHAEQYYRQYKKSWIRSTLRSIQTLLTGKLDGLKNRVRSYNNTLLIFLDRTLKNPARSVEYLAIWFFS